MMMLGPGESKRASAILDHGFSGLSLRGWRSISDWDRDGYGGWLLGGDCAPFNAGIHPGRADVPDNGIDDNCSGSDAQAPPPGDPDFAQANSTVPAPMPKTASPQSIVLITVDSLSAGDMSLYGASEDTTPHLARWARDAMVFEHAYTSGGWTSIALPSMLSGVYPRRMRWTQLYETNRYRLVRASELDKLAPDERAMKAFALPLDEPREQLSELLRRRGMATAAVVDDGPTHWLAPETGMLRAFDRHVRVDDLPAGHANDRGVTDAAIATLDDLQDGAPFFLWVHYFGPHSPSTLTQGIPEFGDSPRQRYRHEIAVTDAQVGRLLARVDGLAEHQQVAVIFTADHGETFHGQVRGHGWNLHDPGIRVPMMLKGSGIEASRVEASASLVDVFATIVALTETPVGAELDGMDLRTLAGRSRRGSPIFTETWRFDARGKVEIDLAAAMTETDIVSNAIVTSTWGEQAKERAGRDEATMGRDSADLRATLQSYLDSYGLITAHP
jgi:hypothetical protein